MQHEFINSINSIDKAQWTALWNTDYPFIQFAFLAALEDSGSTTAESGWQPNHLILRENGQLVGAMPLYLKSHSYGEYVFDWSWADAYHRHGIHYYPKLVNAIPFTPATGPRCAALSTSGHQMFNPALQAYMQQAHYSGFHSLFPCHNNAKNFAINGRYQQRLGCQFHWFNRQYENFEAFLDDFSSRKRKNIKKERAKTQLHGLAISTTLGENLTVSDWEGFYQLYQITYQKRSGHNGYLNREFFVQIGATMPNKTMMVRAYHHDQLVAGALYFYDSQTLYGRYWGSLADFDGLHFECCYYRGIEFAIEHRLARFDPGAQGEHKIQRGFVPVLTQSFHVLQNSSFNSAITDFLAEEKIQTLQYCLEARGYLPFKESVTLEQPNILI